MALVWKGVPLATRELAVSVLCSKEAGHSGVEPKAEGRNRTMIQHIIILVLGFLMLLAWSCLIIAVYKLRELTKELERFREELAEISKELDDMERNLKQ